MKLIRLTALLCVSFSLSLIAVHSASAKSPSTKQSLQEYGQMCAEMIGEIPEFDCNNGTIVPITVDGQTPGRYTQGMTCDRPALLPYASDTFGQCTPYSKVLNLSHDKVQISAFCRREYLRDPNSPMFDEVDVIMHGPDSGKTCWFHAQSPPGQRGGFNASRVPSPTEKTPLKSRTAAENFWWAPAATAHKNCAGCHDASPFMYSPWMGQEWHLVPTDPLGSYSNPGPDFAQWHSSAISTRDNTCVGCHRIGNQASCSIYIPMAAGLTSAPGGDALSKSYPLSHWMPVNNDQSESFWTNANAESVQKLLTCCADPANPMCTITPIIK